MNIVLRRLVIGAGSIALTFGLSAVPSSAQENASAPAASSFVVQVLEHTVPQPGLGADKHIPPRVGTGDADFAGHGPDITAEAKLIFSTGDSRLFMRLCLDAVETKPDRTRAEGCSGDFPIFNAGQGRCIGSVLGATTETLIYRDSDHSDDVFDGQSINGFIKEWEVTGDTGGNEAGTKTGFRITTKPFSINVVNC